MKTCIFILGGNLAGKSTLSRCLADKIGGGIDIVEKDRTLCAHTMILAGRYLKGHNHGGVDSLNGTSQLADIVKRSLAERDLVVCEGSYMDSIGMNITNAFFLAQRYLVVYLYCNLNIVQERQKLRAGHFGQMQSIIKKHQSMRRTALNWRKLGVEVKQYDTGVTPVEVIADDIKKYIEQ